MEAETYILLVHIYSTVLYTVYSTVAVRWPGIVCIRLISLMQLMKREEEEEIYTLYTIQYITYIYIIQLVVR